MIALEGQINTKIDEILKTKQRVEEVIQTVQDGTLQEALDRRYILRETWEQIAVHMNYTYQWTCSLYGKALKELIVIDTQSMI